MSPWLLLIATTVTVGLAFAGLVLMRTRTRPEFGAREWRDALSFSIDKYRPMERLLSRDDADFLRAQAGFNPSMLKTLRRERLKIFRAYLQSMRRDFALLYLAARQSVLLSDLQQSPMLQDVIQQRLVFYWAMSRVEFRLALYSFGIGSVDVRPLLELVDAMRDAAVTLRPVPAAL